jgi:hypothetical protein
METAVKALSNPDVVFQAVAESLPVMLAGGAAGRFVPGVSSAAWRGSIGEGLMAAGSAEESTRQQSPTGLTTRTQGALAAATGASTTLLGRLGSGIATKLGLDDIDTLLACSVVAVFVVLVTQLISDIGYVFLNPRIRLA